MGITAIKQWARVMARANISAFIIGPHGIGKSSAIYQMYLEAAADAKKRPLALDVIAEKMNNSDIGSLSSVDGKHMTRINGDRDVYGFWSVSAANVTMEEFIGMPQVEDRGAIYRQVWLETLKAASRVGEGFEGAKAVHRQMFEYACQELGLSGDDRDRLILRYLRLHALMPDPGHRGGGIWLIDELNLGYPEVEKALMQIILERRYLDYVLPDNIWVVTTMNPPSPEYPGARELALPTADRGAMVTVSSDKDEWLSWAARRGLGEETRIFVDKHDDLLNKVEVDLKLMDIDNPGTYRSVELVDKAYRMMSDEEIRDVGLVVAGSLLGLSAGPVFHREYTETLHRALSLDDVLDDYGWNEGMTKGEEKDFRDWRITKSRSRLMAMIKKANVKSELIRYTLSEIGKWVETLDKDDVKDREGRGKMLNMMLFLHDLPVDIARGFFDEVMQGRVEMLLDWSNSYPLINTFYERIEVEYKEALRESA